MKITIDMIKANPELLATQKRNHRFEEVVEMLQENPELATQYNFDNEKNDFVRLAMVKVNKNLATQDNFNKANKEEDWYVRLEMVIANQKLATQENYDNEENGDVRRVMRKINPALKNN